MSLGIQPAENMVALRFLDDLSEEDDSEPTSGALPTYPTQSKAVAAFCVGVGKKVTVCKKGDTVLVREYARYGLSVGDNTVIVESYCVAAKIVP